MTKPRRWTAVLSIAVVASTALLAGQERSPRERESVIGPVHTIRSQRVSARRVDGRLMEEGALHAMDGVTFDAAGNYAGRDVFDDYGFPVGTTTFRYEGGRLVASTLTDAKGALVERRTYSYGRDRLVETITIAGGSGQSYTERYTHGPRGRVDEITYAIDGRTMGRTAFTYRGERDPATIAFFDAAGKPATATVGPCLGAQRLEYKYANGQVTERTLVAESASFSRHSVFTYDARGNVVEEIRSTAIGKDRFTYEYEFDSRGNWITRIATSRYAGSPETDAPDLLNVFRRVITYY